MSSVKGKDTKPEIKLRKHLWHEGLRYRLHYNLPGKPDIVFVKNRLAIFVDGCFWHGCPKHGSIPETNNEFWETKIKGNLERDIRVTNELIVLGWSVLRIWEHELKDDADEVVERILQQLGGKK